MAVTSKSLDGNFMYYYPQGGTMKRFFIIAAAVLSLLSCISSAPKGDIGSFDAAKVQLLSDGKAAVVDVLSFNDFHGTIYEDPLGKNVGIAKMATVVSRLKTMNPNTVLVSAGDNYQGSALSIVSQGAIISEFFKYIGVSASAVGNHEFDWGDGLFGTWTEQGGFPFLAANLIDKRTGKIASFVKPYTIVRVGGRRIAFIGLTTVETPKSTKAQNVENYEFANPAKTAQYWVNYLKATEKPDVIIGLTHIPSAINSLNKAVAMSASEADELAELADKGGLDAIITGHSHNTVNGKAFSVPVIQASYNGRAFGKIRVTFKEGGGFSIKTDIVEFYLEKAEVQPDSFVQGIIDTYVAKYGAQFLKQVAKLDGELTHDRLLTPNVSPLGYWVCSALKSYYKVDVAVMNGGGLRKPLAAGQLTVQDFWDLMPFDNTAVIFEVSGKDLKDIIDHGIDSLDFANGQFAGLVVQYNPARPYGQKIISMTLADGTPVADDTMYTVVTNDFVFEGGDAYTMILGAAKNVNYTYELIRNAVMTAAEQQKNIAVPTFNVLVPVNK